MDPSYDKDFDSFSSGANAGGSQVGGVGGVQPVGGVGGVQPVNPAAPSQPKGEARPVGSVQRPIVPSQTGDIILKQPEEKKKPRLALIVFLVLVGILLLIGVGIWVSRLIRGDGGRNDFGEVESEYNTYVNYVLFGKDSSEKPDYEAIVDATPYFMTLEQDEKNEYIEKAGKLFETFASVYYDANGEEDLTPLDTYFQKFASIKALTNEDIVKDFVANGREATERIIVDNYRLSGVNFYLSSYLEDEKEAKALYLDMTVKAAEAGCLEGEVLIKGCYTASEEELSGYGTLVSNGYQVADLMARMAFEKLQGLYLDIYNEEEV